MISYDVTAFGKPLERAERPTPEPVGSEILLRVAAWAVDGAAPDALDQVKRAGQQGVWAVIDCVGSAATVAQGLAMLTKGGQFVIVGLFGGEMSLSPALLPMRAVSIVGSYIGNLGELQDPMELVRRQRPATVPLDCRCLDEAGAAMQALAAGQVVGRVILKPGSQT